MFTFGSGENISWDIGKCSVIDLAHGKFLGYQRNKIDQFYLAGSTLKLPSKPSHHLQQYFIPFILSSDIHRVFCTAAVIPE